MKKILTIKLASLGDIILFTPILKELSNEKTEIYHLTSNTCSKILDGNPYIKELIEIDELNPKKGKLKNFLILLNLYFKLRKYKFDEIYLFHRNKILVNLCKILNPRKFKYFGNENKIINHKIEECKFDLKEHRIQRNLKLVSKKKYKKNLYKTEIYLDKFSNLKIPFEDYTVISPGGGSNSWSDMPSRRWSKENYIELINKIKGKIIIIGGKNDVEISQYIKENTYNKDIQDYTGKLKLEDTAKIIKYAKLYIGNDSMPLFMASSYEGRVIGIFTSTSGKLIMPLEKEYIQTSCECSPCYNPLEGTGIGKAYVCKDIECTRKKIMFEKLGIK